MVSEKQQTEEVKVPETQEEELQSRLDEVYTMLARKDVTQALLQHASMLDRMFKGKSFAAVSVRLGTGWNEAETNRMLTMLQLKGLVREVTTTKHFPHKKFKVTLNKKERIHLLKQQVEDIVRQKAHILKQIKELEEEATS